MKKLDWYAWALVFVIIAVASSGEVVLAIALFAAILLVMGVFSHD